MTAPPPTVPGLALAERLGKGGFGSVYRAHWEDDLLPAAVKVLHEVTDDCLDRFKREANLLRALEGSPHVVDVHAWDMDADPPWMAMELCEDSLASWMDDRKDVKTVMVAIAHAASGLADLHEEGGFHRDVKPANLLVGRASNGAPVIKIGDFGLARSPLVDESTLTRLGHGTPAFIAPEMQRYRDAAGPPCDVYSLGVSALCLITGTTNLDHVKRLPLGLQPLISEMVAMDPRNRPSAEQALSRLQQLIRRASVKPRKPKPKRRRRIQPQDVGAGALAGILLGALAIGGALLGAGLYDEADETDE